MIKCGNNMAAMKKGNKQCLFYTPNTVMDNTENDVRVQDTKAINKYAKSRFLMMQLISYKL